MTVPTRAGDGPPPSGRAPVAESCRLPRRLLAMAYDGLLLGSALFLATLAVLPLSRGEAIRPGNPWYTSYLLCLGYLYFAWPWMHGGQTLGMRAWGIRLIRNEAGPLRARETLLRFAGALLCWIPAGLGFLYAGVDPLGRTLPDLLSGTRLIRVTRGAGKA